MIPIDIIMHLNNKKRNPGDAFLSGISFFVRNLFCAEDPVSGVSQARADIGGFVQLPV